MPSDGFFAWFDNGFEPQWFAVGILSRVCFAHRELTNGKPQKIESHVLLKVNYLSHQMAITLAEKGFLGTFQKS